MSVLEKFGLPIGWGTGLTTGLEIAGAVKHSFTTPGQAIAFGLLTFLLSTGVTYVGQELGQGIRNRSSQRNRRNLNF